MAIYYLDLVNGSDAATGADWANAWKTITGGPTAARIVPGDIIRIAKTPDPTDTGQDVTLTFQSVAVTLESAVTANIETCESAWEASADVVCGTGATVYKEGTKSAYAEIGADFTTGKVAYKTITETDFSGYQQISLWVRATAAVAASTFRIDLCSDTTGDTPVDSYTIDVPLKTNQWAALTYDTAGALGSAIQSVALTALLDPGAVTVSLDNIIACKASSSADSITLTSLVGTGIDSDGWYPIESINGTALRLGNSPVAAKGSTSNRGYCGITGTYSLWKRETFKTTIPSNQTDSVAAIQDDGTSGNLITFSGGWNTSTTVQDGETFMSGTCNWGYGINMNGKDYIVLERLGLVAYYIGISAATATDNDTFKNLWLSGDDGGIYVTAAATNLKISGCVINSCYSTGLTIQLSSDTVTVRNTMLSGCGDASFAPHTTTNTFLYDCTLRNSRLYGVAAYSGAVVVLYRCLVGDNGTNFSLHTGATAATPITSRHHNAPGRFVIVQNLSGSGAKGYVQDSITTGLDTTWSHRGVGPCPIIYPLQTGEANATTWSITIPVKANVVQAFSYWAKKSSSTATVALKTEAFDTGSSVIVLNDDRPILTDTWAQYNLVFTPTADGDCTVKFSGIYGGSGEYIGIDDFGFMGY